MKRRHFTQAGLILVTDSLMTSAHAQSWPDKTIKWTLSQPPGSGPDNVARILSDRLAKQWGQAVVIETA